jgi:hypothetical protein
MAKTASSTTGALVGAGSLWPETFILLKQCDFRQLLAPSHFLQWRFFLSKRSPMCFQNFGAVNVLPTFTVYMGIPNFWCHRRSAEQWSTEPSILYLLFLWQWLSATIWHLLIFLHF